MWDRRAEYLHNHDGDNATMRLDQGFDDTKKIEVRLLGVFAPEMDETGGPDVQDFVNSWFNSRVTTRTPWNFIVTTTRMKVADREQKTLDRYVGLITSMDTTDSLNMAVMQYITSKGYGHGIGSKS